MKEDSVFTKIIKRELPAEIIYEDDKVIVIPDRFPSMEGQLLVITKAQEPYAFALDDETYQHVLMMTKKMSTALDKAFNTTRTCVVIEGFDVPHVHIRLYPCKNKEIIWSPRKEATDEKLKEVADKVRAVL